MTADARLTSTLDLQPGASLLDGDALVGQRIRIRLQQASGGWVLDSRSGLPWLAWLAQKPFPVDAATARIRQEIEAVPGVLQVQTLTVSRSGVSATVTGDVLTASGVLPLAVAVGGGGVPQAFAGAPWAISGAAP